MSHDKQTLPIIRASALVTAGPGLSEAPLGPGVQISLDPLDTLILPGFGTTVTGGVTPGAPLTINAAVEVTTETVSLVTAAGHSPTGVPVTMSATFTKYTDIDGSQYVIFTVDGAGGIYAGPTVEWVFSTIPAAFVPTVQRNGSCFGAYPSNNTGGNFGAPMFFNLDTLGDILFNFLLDSILPAPVIGGTINFPSFSGWYKI